MTNNNYYYIGIRSMNNIFIAVFFKGFNYYNIGGPAIRLRRMFYSIYLSSIIHIIYNNIYIYIRRLKQGKKIRNRSVNAICGAK